MSWEWCNKIPEKNKKGHVALYYDENTSPKNFQKYDNQDRQGLKIMPQKDILVGWEGAERSFVQVKTTTWFMIGMEPSLPKTQWSVITFYNLEKVLTDIILSFITITKKMEFRKPQTKEEWDQFLSRNFKTDIFKNGIS